MKNNRILSIIGLIFVVGVFALFCFVTWMKVMTKAKGTTGKTSSQSLPADYPIIPLYSDSKLISANKSITPKGNSYAGVWQTNKSVVEVTDWYIKAIRNSGWNIDILPANTPGNSISYLVAKKADVVLQLSVINKPQVGTEITANFPADYGINGD